MVEEKVRALVRDVPDFPKQGIIFKDLTPVLLHAQLCREIAESIHKEFSQHPIHAIASMESRGFWFGMLIAQIFNVPFIPIRKKGKLPYDTFSCNYSLEYGEECIEMHTDAIQPGANVLIHDDVLATGGTASAAAELIIQAGGKIAGFSFILSLEFLNGRDKLTKYNQHLHTLVSY